MPFLNVRAQTKTRDQEGNPVALPPGAAPLQTGPRVPMVLLPLEEQLQLPPGPALICLASPCIVTIETLRGGYSMIQFLREVGEVFGADLPHALCRSRVPDIGIDGNCNLRMVLLCESPHTKEVHCQHPLAGRSGEEVTATFSELRPGIFSCENEARAIGRLVHDGHDDVGWLGIMNVSELPFQKGAYRGQDILGSCAGWREFKRCMAHIKKEPTVQNQNYDVAEINSLQRAITKHLVRRLCGLPNNVSLICCGKVAQAYYFKATCCLETNRSILGLPHPGRNGWACLEDAYRCGLQRFLNSIQL